MATNDHYKRVEKGQAMIKECLKAGLTDEEIVKKVFEELQFSPRWTKTAIDLLRE